MKQKAVIEVTTESLAEEQFLLSRFPDARWIALGEHTRFYIPYQEFHVVQETIEEWENSNGR